MLSLLTCAHHRLKNLHVASAAAKIASQSVTNLLFVGIRMFFEQTYRCDDHARRTNAALRPTAFKECLLHRMQLIFAQGDAFNCPNRTPFDLTGRHETTIDDLSIDQHGARAALAFATALFRSGKMQLLTQDVEQTLH